MKKSLIILLISLVCGKLPGQVTINSYASSTLTDKGMFGKSEKIAEIILPALKEYKVAKADTNLFYIPSDPRTVDISLLSQATSEVIGNNIIYRQKIVGLDAISVKVYFDRLKLSQNAKMYIYTPSGLVVTGPVASTENIEKGRIWGSNSFPDSSIIIEILIPANEKLENDIHISQITLGVDQKKLSASTDPASFGHYGYTDVCAQYNHIMCAGTDWANERKAVCLIEFEEGPYTYNGTGALVANTCNVNIPYLLTAYHNIYGHNPNNWQFYFGWWSPYCYDYYTQTAFLFNGANVKASYEPTDFALLELFDIPSSSAAISYLGWSRSSTAATSSAAIHHPGGDQMRIAISSSSATGDNLPGYTGTAWKANHTYGNGATQPGSSGCPMFNQDKRVVGQLWGGNSSSNDCNARYSLYGRFDLSWTGGGTNTTRLSNWLDPTNTGAVTTNTTNVALFTVTITGPDGICLPATSATYNINNLPTCGTNVVTWSTNVPQVTVSPLTGITTTVNANGYTGLVTLTATVSGFVSTVATKLIYIGTGPGLYSFTPYITQGDVTTYMSTYCNKLTYVCSTNNQLSNKGVNPGSNILSPYSYCASGYITDPTANSITWSVLQTSTGTFHGTYSFSDNQFNVGINLNYTSEWIILRCTRTNACGSAYNDYKFYATGWCFASPEHCQLYPNDPGCPQDIAAPPPETSTAKVSIAPNPTSGQFTVSLSTTAKTESIKEIIITNKMGIPVYQQKFTNNQKKQTINLYNQPTDIYLVEVFDGVKWVTEKLSLQR